MRHSTLLPKFVDAIPETPQEGVLYISIRFRTATHLCACGCGSKVVTPIKPAKWQLTYDGETVSLWPSIGRWQLPCRSHYWVRRNNIAVARPFSDTEMEAVLRSDAEDLHDYYVSRQVERVEIPSGQENKNGRPGLMQRIRDWIRSS